VIEGPLRHELARLTRALRRHAAVNAAAVGGLAALVAGTLLAVLSRLVPLLTRQQLALALAWGVTLGSVAGALLGWTWPRPLRRRLRRLDRGLGLADRLTTAWELATGRIAAPPALISCQREETLEAARRVDPRAAYPPRPPARVRRVLALLALVLVPLLLLPNPQEEELARRIAARERAEREAERVESLIETVAETPAFDPATREAALQALEEALAVLRDPAASEEGRRAALTEAERRLSALQRPEASARVRRLAEAAPLSEEEVLRPLVEALEAGDPEAAADYLRALLEPGGEPLTLEESLALADALSEMAERLAGSDPGLAERFREVAGEIYTGDRQDAAEALNRAAEALSEAGQAQAPNEALETAQGQLQAAREGLGGEGDGQGTGRTAGDGGEQGAPGAQGTAGEGAGPDAAGHQEDAGSGAPYGAAGERVSGQGGEVTLPRSPVEGETPRVEPGAPNPARVPYEQVYVDYADAAEAELSRRALPPALRGYVRDYFGALGE
jgi:hypothetical protein